MTGSAVIRSGFPIPRPAGNARREAEPTIGSDPLRVFVIAGPTGSGKSTLMREFVCGRLPKDIADYLPEEAKTWHHTSANELTRKGLSWILRHKVQDPGLVVHYDIMRVRTRGFEHYANDPAIEAVTGIRAALTIMTLLPSREILFEQFLRRCRTGEYEEVWEKKRLLRRSTRKLRTAFNRLTGKGPQLLKEGHLDLLGVYGSDHGVEQWTIRWEEFLESVQCDRGDVRLVYVAPEPAQEGHPRFRLLRCV